MAQLHHSLTHSVLCIQLYLDRVQGAPLSTARSVSSTPITLRNRRQCATGARGRAGRDPQTARRLGAPLAKVASVDVIRNTSYRSDARASGSHQSPCFRQPEAAWTGAISRPLARASMYAIHSQSVFPVMGLPHPQALDEVHPSLFDRNIRRNCVNANRPRRSHGQGKQGTVGPRVLLVLPR
ncbi:hypothetical protein BD309DRAFT_910365 [Dichomitus squalens]|nr:hypothetical protein BD309DRAFT_910365 [Dichomitus squalens]